MRLAVHLVRASCAICTAVRMELSGMGPDHPRHPSMLRPQGGTRSGSGRFIDRRGPEKETYLGSSEVVGHFHTCFKRPGRTECSMARRASTSPVLRCTVAGQSRRFVLACALALSHARRQSLLFLRVMASRRSGNGDVCFFHWISCPL